jgi:hypothetical protein
MSANTEFICRITDGTTVVNLTPSFDHKIHDELVLSEARSKSGSLFRYKWGAYQAYEFDFEKVPIQDAMIINEWHRNNSSLSLSLGTPLDIDAAFYFPFDESSGNLAWDSVNSYCLTFSGHNPDIVTGLFGGRARQLDTNKQGISTTAISSLSNNCDLWVSFGFLLDSIVDTYSGGGFPVSMMSYAGGHGWNIRYTNNKILFYVATGSGTSSAYYGTYVMETDHIYQLILALRSQNAAIYMKDWSVNSFSCVFSDSVSITYGDAGSNFLSIHKLSYDLASYQVNGDIDELRFGFQTLTQADIEFLATSRMVNPQLPIRKPVKIMGDKSPFKTYDKPYLSYLKGTLLLESV